MKIIEPSADIVQDMLSGLPKLHTLDIVNHLMICTISISNRDAYTAIVTQLASIVFKRLGVDVFILGWHPLLTIYEGERAEMTPGRLFYLRGELKDLAGNTQPFASRVEKSEIKYFMNETELLDREEAWE